MKTTLYLNNVPKMGPLEAIDADYGLTTWDFYVILCETTRNGNWLEIAWTGVCMESLMYRPQRHD